MGESEERSTPPTAPRSAYSTYSSAVRVRQEDAYPAYTSERRYPPANGPVDMRGDRYASQSSADRYTSLSYSQEFVPNQAPAAAPRPYALSTSNPAAQSATRVPSAPNRTAYQLTPTSEIPYYWTSNPAAPMQAPEVQRLRPVASTYSAAQTPPPILPANSRSPTVPIKPVPVVPNRPYEPTATNANSYKPSQPAQVSQFTPVPPVPINSQSYNYYQAPAYAVPASSLQSVPAKPAALIFMVPTPAAPKHPLSGNVVFVSPSQPAKPADPNSRFNSLEYYKEHFLQLLELERIEETKAFSELFKTARIYSQSPRGNRTLYSLQLRTVEDLSFGDQLLLHYSHSEDEIVHIHELIEIEKKVEFLGKYSDDKVMVEYYQSLPHRRMVEKLKSLNEEHPLLELLLRNDVENSCEWGRNGYVPSARVRLDDSQKAAISAALQRKVTLILGPPGSGKTSVAAELVVQLCKRQDKILVCAPSNVAADNLALRLKEKQVRVLRFYSKGSEVKTNIADKFAFHSYVHSLACVLHPQHTAKLLASKNYSRNAVKQIIGDDEAQALERDVLSTFPVICSTCSASADAILKDFIFDSVLIDEAAFCCEPEAMIPIITSKCKKLILIGDPKQLRPIIASDEAKNGGLETSLYERLQRIAISTQWLEVQYRMHPDISFFPRTCFYEGRLKDGITAEDRSLANLPVNELFKGKPLLFVNCEGEEDYYSNSTSRWNAEEAETTLSVLERLRQLEVPLNSIGLVTPYDGQRKTLVKRALERLGLKEKEVEIKSVDGYQGREKDFIVMSCVRSGGTNIGFLANVNRINVALTRAKYGLVVVGNRQTLKIDTVWAGFLNCVQERGRFITETQLQD